MKASDYLSREELAYFTERSDAWGWWLVFSNWALITAIFAAVALWTNPLTVLLAIPLLGGRQLGLAVLMHEAGHKTLFKTQRLNETVGQWLTAYPVLGDCVAYGNSHREHHRLAGTHDDPDLPNYHKYPVSAASFRRKMFRDITGQTGIKGLIGTFRGAGNPVMMRKSDKSSALSSGLIVNALLFGVLWLLGEPWLFLLWVAAYIISYPLVARIRQVAEHGNVPGLYELDPRGNTRTTRANIFERFWLCPNDVNYHIEHHMLPSVPCWRLKELHQLLETRGFYKDHPEAIADGYLDVIRRAVPEFNNERPAAA